MKVLIKHVLYVDSICGVNPAGPRLIKGGEFPINDFKFDSESEAQAASLLLQAYLDGETGTKETLKQGVTKEKLSKSIFGK